MLVVPRWHFPLLRNFDFYPYLIRWLGLQWSKILPHLLHGQLVVQEGYIPGIHGYLLRLNEGL